MEQTLSLAWIHVGTLVLSTAVILVTIGITFGKLMGGHKSNAIRVGMLEDGFATHVVQEKNWQQETGERIASIEATVNHIDKTMNGGWSKP